MTKHLAVWLDQDQARIFTSIQRESKKRLSPRRLVAFIRSIRAE